MRKHDLQVFTKERATGPSPEDFEAPECAMTAGQPCHLTSRDYTLLQAHLVKFEERADGIFQDLKSLMRFKLHESRVVLSEDIPATVATGNSRLVYVADGQRETRILTHWHDQLGAGLGLPITTFLGLTLLGMSEGQSAPLPRADGSEGQVVLEKVAYQPEYATRLQSRMSGNI